MNAEERTEFALTNGHPPVADGVVCVDFDGTLHPWGGMFDYPEPMSGGPEFMTRLRAEGYNIVIFTSRLSLAWLTEEYGQNFLYGAKLHRTYVTDWCRRYGIPFDDVTAEKIPALCYIDDKAIHFDDWGSASEQFFQKAARGHHA